MKDTLNKNKIKCLVKDQVKELKAYGIEKDPMPIKLDANESPYELPNRFKEKIKDIISYDTLNRYPDPRARELCSKLANYVGNNVTKEMIIVGDGSDELINITMNTFLNSGSNIVISTPSFVMYNIYATINEANIIEFESDENFDWDIDGLIQIIKLKNPGLVFLCNPNNPTGNLTSRESIIKLIENTDCMVVIDEAYIEYCNETVADLVNIYDNLIVLRTMSKAWGLAGIRLGYLISNKAVIDQLLKVKAPYNVNTITQEIASFMLDYKDHMEDNVKTILNERDFIIKELKTIKDIKIFNTSANFILLQVPDADMLTQSLKEYGIGIRNFNSNPKLKNCVRISVGTEEENKKLIEAFKTIINR